MSKIVTSMTPELRAEMINVARAFVEAIPDGAKVECEMARGVDEFEEPGASEIRHRVNGTATLALLVNGGAQDRDTTHEELMAHAMRLADGSRDQGP